MSELTDILNGRGPSDEVWAVRDSSDSKWIGTADKPALYTDKVSGKMLLSAQSRAKCAAMIYQIQFGRPFEFAIYNGGEWKDTIMTNDGQNVIQLV